jgi:hypothetical protein
MKFLSPSLIGLLLTVAVDSQVTPDGTCGLIGAGNGTGYTCPSNNQCCSSSGWCGTSDLHCLTTTGCQAEYSVSAEACHAPIDGETVSPDGTCGTTVAGQYGYTCPETGFTCCSVAGYCGDSAAHCSVANGCQPGYGICT